MAKAARLGNLTPAEVARRAVQLGARVEHNRHVYAVYPPNPDCGPVFVSDRFSNGTDRMNALSRLRRAGLDVTTEPDPQPSKEPAVPNPTAPSPTMLARANGAATVPPGLAALREQVETMLGMLAEADARDTAHQSAIAELRAEVADLRGDTNRLRTDLTRTRNDLTRLGRDLAAGGPPKDPHAELDEAILAFMAATPIRLTAGVISSNITVEATPNQVGKRMQALTAAGRAVVVDAPGVTGKVYQLPASPD